MTATLTDRKEEQVSPASSAKAGSGNQDRWARLSTIAGAAVWAVLAVAARVGLARIAGIELLFAFAPLVIVPLGLELGRVMLSQLLGPQARPQWVIGIDLLARRAQPFLAGFAVVSLLLPPGRRAGLAAWGWMLVCLLQGAAGAADFLSSWSDAGARLVDWTLFVARVDLLVGGSALVASRLGTHPFGIQEPIGLLTAVHFHFAGFATAMIAAAMLRFSAGRAFELRLRWLVPFVIAMPYLVAIGFVTSPLLKMAAAVAFSASLAALAMVLRSLARRAERSAARLLLQVSAAAVFAAMVLSTAYAIADFSGSDGLRIPQMARTHGILNAMGFSMAGLLGWIVEWEN
jgi:hypothetical protein